jgi:hypothetical protein
MGVLYPSTQRHYCRLILLHILLYCYMFRSYDHHQAENILLARITPFPSEMSAEFQRTTWRFIPEDGTLHNHCCENHKSCWQFTIDNWTLYTTGGKILIDCLLNAINAKNVSEKKILLRSKLILIIKVNSTPGRTMTRWKYFFETVLFREIYESLRHHLRIVTFYFKHTVGTIIILPEMSLNKQNFCPERFHTQCTTKFFIVTAVKTANLQTNSLTSISGKIPFAVQLNNNLRGL